MCSSLLFPEFIHKVAWFVQNGLQSRLCHTILSHTHPRGLRQKQRGSVFWHVFKSLLPAWQTVTILNKAEKPKLHSYTFKDWKTAVIKCQACKAKNAVWGKTLRLCHSACVSASGFWYSRWGPAMQKAGIHIFVAGLSTKNFHFTPRPMTDILELYNINRYATHPAKVAITTAGLPTKISHCAPPPQENGHRLLERKRVYLV
jgi:hypothetical protein